MSEPESFQLDEITGTCGLSDQGGCVFLLTLRFLVEDNSDG
jgi:hypothetical protein